MLPVTNIYNIIGIILPNDQKLYGTNQLQHKRDTQVTRSKNAWHMHGHAKFKLCVCLRVLSEVLSEVLSLNYWIIVSKHFEAINRTL